MKPTTLAEAERALASVLSMIENLKIGAFLKEKDTVAITYLRLIKRTIDQALRSLGLED
jgi:hypothetical protein